MKLTVLTHKNPRKGWNLKLIAIALIGLTLFASCSDDDDNDPTPTPTPPAANLNLNLSGLEDLGSNFTYEGWIIVNNAPVSTGTFTVDGNGNLSQSGFNVDQSQLDAATMFVLSIEPVPDNDPAPAATKILSGAFSGNSANVSTGTVSAAGFSGIAGNYFLATPTDGPGNDYSGIWFIDNSSGSMMPGLTLPALEAGWKYEGWAVINGTPVSTGTFTNVSATDDAAPFSGMMGGPPFPGEDFIVNAPAGLTFPVDIRGGNAVISIEPVPDNSPDPFTLKPLAGMIPSGLAAMTVASMNDNVSASFPSGTVSR